MAAILLINPNTSARTTEMMLAAALPLLPDGMTMRGVQAAAGAAMILDEDALEAASQEVARIRMVEAERADAIIVTAFGNPGTAQLRERLDIPWSGSARPLSEKPPPVVGGSASPPPRPAWCARSRRASAAWAWKAASPDSACRAPTRCCSPPARPNRTRR